MEAAVVDLRPSDEQNLSRYLGRCATLIGLQGWEFEVRFDHPAPPDEIARIDIIYSRRIGIVRFAKDIRSLAESDLRHAVAHELIHAHLAEMEEVVRGLRGPIGTVAFEHVWTAYDRAQEVATDTIARVVEDVLPLIEW